MLSGSEIRKQVEAGNIFISDFTPERLNPNSYNLRLSNVLYEVHKPVDMKRRTPLKRHVMTPEGFTLQPGRFYLGSTIESTFTSRFVPCLDGRSSVARLGLAVHITAGFGDVGFNGRWTLELIAAVPTTIYPGCEICQIYFHPVEGETDILYRGKYQHSIDAMDSRMYKEFE